MNNDEAKSFALRRAAQILRMELSHTSQWALTGVEGSHLHLDDVSKIQNVLSELAVELEQRSRNTLE